jgi:hypothetical protein
MVRPFVIPMRNGWLTAYMCVPMGLACFTIFTLVQSAVHNVQDAVHYPNGLPFSLF